MTGSCSVQINTKIKPGPSSLNCASFYDDIMIQRHGRNLLTISQKLQFGPIAKKCRIQTWIRKTLAVTFVTTSAKYMWRFRKTKTATSWDPLMECYRIVSVCLCALHQLWKRLLKSEMGSWNFAKPVMRPWQENEVFLTNEMSKSKPWVIPRSSAQEGKLSYTTGVRSKKASSQSCIPPPSLWNRYENSGAMKLISSGKTFCSIIQCSE